MTSGTLNLRKYLYSWKFVANQISKSFYLPQDMFFPVPTKINFILQALPEKELTIGVGHK